LGVNGEAASLSELHGKRVAAFCGIGNPSGFRNTLLQCHCKVIAWREFPDHSAYNEPLLAELNCWASSHKVDVVVCTHKDLVKLTTTELGGHKLWAVTVGMEFTAGQDALEKSLDQVTENAESLKN
jgi:tetraacyldisaccharide 4'-kinase